MLFWHKLPDLPDGLSEITIAGKKICIIHNGQKIHACSALCPHAGGTLASGYEDALGSIVCPVHHYRFSLTNGRNTSGEGYHLKMYHVEVREDGVYIGITDAGKKD